MNQITSKITKQELIAWRELKWLQSSKLKDLGARGIEKLKNSLKENNFVQPFNVWQDSKGVVWILDGHHREKALKQLEAEGYEIPELLPANFVDCADRKAAAKMVLVYSSIYAKITNDGLGEFLDDFELDLANILDEIDIPGLDLDNLLTPEELPADADEAPPVLEKAYSILGDVFEIDGKHRVMCGDSTKETDVSILMNGSKADMVLTDPPYNVSYVGKTKNALTIKNDSMEADAFQEFLVACFKKMNEHLKAGGVFYIWHAETEGYNFRAACAAVGWAVRQCLIWNKNSMVMGRQDYHWKHEPCLYGWKEGSHKWYGDRKQTTIIDFARPNANDVHPTMKPVGLLVKQILNSSTKNNVITDLFLGSGSTLIAAESTKRICFGMELDQHYCDVILRRYKKTYPDAQMKCLTRPDFPFEELFNA